MISSYNVNIGTGVFTLFDANPGGPDAEHGPCSEFVVYVSAQNTKVCVYDASNTPLVVDFVQRSGVQYPPYRWVPNKIAKVTAQTATGVAATVSWGVTGKDVVVF